MLGRVSFLRFIFPVDQLVHFHTQSTHATLCRLCINYCLKSSEVLKSWNPTKPSSKSSAVHRTDAENDSRREERKHFQSSFLFRMN